MNRQIVNMRFFLLAVIAFMAASIVLIPEASAGKREDALNEQARRARLAAYVALTQSMSTDDTAFYAKLLATENVSRFQARTPGERQWSLFEQLTVVPKNVNSDLIPEFIQTLYENPEVPDYYYGTILSEISGPEQFALIQNWVKTNPSTVGAYSMMAFLKGYLAENADNPEAQEVFGDVIAGRSGEEIADEVLADIEPLRARFGIEPHIEQVRFRMLALRKDTAAIENYANSLARNYSTDPVLGPVLIEAFSSIGKEKEANRMRIKVFEENPSGQMAARLFGSLKSREDSLDLVGAIGRSIRRPDLDLDDKVSLIEGSAEVLTAGDPDSEEQADFVLSLADTVADAAREVAAEYSDDLEAVERLANPRNRSWLAYKGYPILIDYALGHPDSLDINEHIVTNLLNVVDSVSELGTVIQNLMEKAPDRMTYRLFYPVWLSNISRYEEAAQEYGKITRDDIRRAVLEEIDKHKAEDEDYEVPDSASVEEMTNSTWVVTNNYYSSTLAMLKRYGEAADVLLGVLDYSGNSDDERAQMLNNIAYFMCEADRDYEEALALADSSLVLARSTPTIDTRAWLLHKLGRDKEAYEQMSEIFNRPTFVGGITLNFDKLVDYKQFFAELNPVWNLIKKDLDVEDILPEDIEPDYRHIVLLIMGADMELQEDAVDEYIYHLYEIVKGLGDDYKAYSVAVWLEPLRPEDDKLAEEIKELRTRLGIREPVKKDKTENNENE